MNVTYNIAQLFDLAFGIKSLAVYDVGQVDVDPSDVNFNYAGISPIGRLHEVSRMSYLGTPIILPLYFSGGGHNVFNQDGDVVTKSFSHFEMPAATLVSFRRAKIITKTKALAANGTVKEMYGFDDWHIDIRGLCLADPSRSREKTAYEQKVMLSQWEEIVGSIEVISELFNDIGIDAITIDEISFDQLKAKPGVIPFYMRCSSDEPLELIL